MTDDFDALLQPGQGTVSVERHQRVARSRREWIDAATSVLPGDWNGTPDDLRRDLAALLSRARREAEADTTLALSYVVRAAREMPGVLRRALLEDLLRDFPDALDDLEPADRERLLGRQQPGG